MTPKDLITVRLLILGVVWGTGMLILWRRNKSKPEMWPRIFGVGTGVYGFVSLMLGSILFRPISELVNYTITNFFWSLVLSIIAYFGGRRMARHFQDKN
ncbi:MAG: hypothetical protein L0Z71_16195 [Anaerolineae bacterium]|nr:hypothetical protein [Anaerolineae bacterium]